MVLAKKISKSITTNIPLLLEIKIKKKVQNSQNIFGRKIAAYIMTLSAL